MTFIQLRAFIMPRSRYLDESAHVKSALAYVNSLLHPSVPTARVCVATLSSIVPDVAQTVVYTPLNKATYNYYNVFFEFDVRSTSSDLGIVSVEILWKSFASATPCIRLTLTLKYTGYEQDIQRIDVEDATLDSFYHGRPDLLALESHSDCTTQSFSGMNSPVKNATAGCIGMTLVVILAKTLGATRIELVDGHTNPRGEHNKTFIPCSYYKTQFLFEPLPPSSSNDCVLDISSVDVADTDQLEHFTTLKHPERLYTQSQGSVSIVGGTADDGSRTIISGNYRDHVHQVHFDDQLSSFNDDITWSFENAVINNNFAMLGYTKPHHRSQPLSARVIDTTFNLTFSSIVKCPQIMFLPRQLRKEYFDEIALGTNKGFETHPPYEQTISLERFEIMDESGADYSTEFVTACIIYQYKNEPGIKRGAEITLSLANRSLKMTRIRY